tara:strand:+ start:952 stop:1503 length:552 start_codon:yes stop_codon:yes gene_type:complete
LAVGVGKVQQALPFFKTALDANPNIAQFWMSYIDALIKLDQIDDAKAMFNKAKSNGAKGDGFDKIKEQLGLSSNNKEPPQEQVQPIIDLFNQAQLHQALEQAIVLLQKFPGSATLYNIIGATNQGLGKLDEAIKAYKKAISIKRNYAEAYSNMGVALQSNRRLMEAIDAYEKAISIKPDYAEA